MASWMVAPPFNDEWFSNDGDLLVISKSRAIVETGMTDAEAFRKEDSRPPLISRESGLFIFGNLKIRVSF
jgi:hypothetical protein